MPIFGKKEEPAPPPPPTKTGLFSRRRSSSPDTSSTISPNRSSTRGGLGGLLHRDREDPSITQARQRVSDAEEAERQADRALAQSRSAVREAREHVKRLEHEAAEEARLAKIKQGQAAKIGKSAGALGRHDKV